jgi:tight adherence protein C
MGMAQASQLDLAVLTMFTAGLAVFCAAIGFAWPYLFPNILDGRVRLLAEARQRNRFSDSARPAETQKRSLLTSEPKRIYAAVVRRLNLARYLEDEPTQQRLQKAGFRGRAPVMTFVAMRVLMPLTLFGVSAFYIFILIQPDMHNLLKWALVAALAGFGFYVPALFVKNRTDKRQKSIIRAWPNALDLLLICIESGMSVEHAFRKVADEISSQSRELAQELSLTTAELSYLSDRRTAYENLGRRTDLEGVKSVVSGLMQSEQYGTSLGNALRVLTQENREMRMSLAEKKAASLSPMLTVPMIMFFLPVLFAVIITPAVIQILNE